MKFKKSAMAISAAGLLAIAGFEGFSGSAYQPLPGDKWTIGFGHTDGVEEGDTMSVSYGLELLRRDASKAEEAVNRLVTIQLKQYQFDALVSLVYNIGETNFRKSTLLRCLNRGDLYGTEKQWMRWVYFKGEKVSGLENRRSRELAIFRGQQITDGVAGGVCFGDAGCISVGDLLQESVRDPDNAEFG